MILVHLIQTRAPLGTYHFANDGEAVSWYEFAEEILKNMKTRILPTSTVEYQQLAKRPAQSSFSLFRAKATNFYIEG